MNRQHHQQPTAFFPSVHQPLQQFTQPAGVHARLAALKRRLAPQIAAFEKAQNHALYGNASTRQVTREAISEGCLVDECA